MMTQDGWWIATAAALAVALVAALADRRRIRRESIDDIGWIPWRGVQVAAFFAALGAAILAMRG